MKILVVIPAFNEENFIKLTLDSFLNQTYKNFNLIVVNDGSTDKTESIASAYIDKFNSFKIVNSYQNAEHQPGAKVVRTFYKGLQTIDYNKFDLICKFDADIILPKNYFEIIVEKLKSDVQIGMIGGHIYVEKNKQWIYENVANKKHIRGAIKSYRTSCFKAIGGIRETIGWDNIDELIAIQQGWKVEVLPELKVKLLKETGFVYQKSKAEKLGNYFYQLGLDPVLTLISCFKAGYTNKNIKLIFKSYVTYLKLYFASSTRKISLEEQKFINSYRWKKFFENFRSLKKNNIS